MQDVAIFDKISTDNCEFRTETIMGT